MTGALRVAGPNVAGMLRIAFGTDRRGVGTTLTGRLGGRRIVLAMPGVWSP